MNSNDKRDNFASREHLAKAEAVLKADNLENALLHYEAALRLDSCNEQAKIGLRCGQSTYHYRKGVALHKTGKLRVAVQEYQQAISLGMERIPEIEEWIKLGVVKANDWKGIENFATKLERLIELNDELYQKTPTHGYVDWQHDAYPIAENGLRSLDFEFSYLYPLMKEVTTGKHETLTLGLIISAMINKLMTSDNVVTLDLSKFCANQKEWGEGWTGDYLGTRHKSGKLVIKGGIIWGGCLPAELCYQMSGGEVLIYSDFGGRLCLGDEMAGGKIELHGKRLDGCNVIIGQNMRDGSIYVKKNAIRIVNPYESYMIDIGGCMKGGEIHVEGDVISGGIGNGMEDGKIYISGAVKSGHGGTTNVGNSMKGGIIRIYGDLEASSFSSGYSFSTLGCGMQAGEIIIDGVVIAVIGGGMTGGRIKIAREGAGLGCKINYDWNGIKGGEVIIDGLRAFPVSMGYRIKRLFS